ncbi:unnamed protein product [Wickerhamomyces anomalus]
MDSVSSFFQWENDEGSNTQKNSSKNQARNSNSSLSFDFNNFFNSSGAEGKQSTTIDPSSLQLKDSTHSKNQISSSNTAASSHYNKSPSNSSSASAKQNYMSQQLTDKLIEKLISIALPPTNEFSLDSLEGRVQAGKLRPGLSVQTMSRNFIQLNSRLSFPFEMIDNIIKFFNWDNPKLTLTIMVLYTHLILKPLPMMLSLPFCLIIIYIMAPAYAIRHQPEYHSIIETRYYLLNKTNKFEQILEENFGFIEPQEQREVEIFEIQNFDKKLKEWNFLFYLNNDFTKLSKPRLDKKYTNVEIIGTTSLQNVKPPKDWEFIKNDQWKIDLNPESWVSNHLLNDLVKVDNETKWVYDVDVE